jgi:hypothetical protein
VVPIHRKWLLDLRRQGIPAARSKAARSQEKTEEKKRTSEKGKASMMEGVKLYNLT